MILVQKDRVRELPFAFLVQFDSIHTSQKTSRAESEQSLGWWPLA